jgi:O-antigen/teichoic acid export membrane protein
MTSTCAMLVALLLMFALIPRFGMAGAALARLAYSVATVLFHLQAHRILKSRRAAGL